jgi:putative redox protein
MRVELKRVDGAFHTVAIAENGKSVEFDGSVKIGGNDLGVSPMQSLLMAMGGCSAIDVVMILQKQKQEIKDFQISIDGEREAGTEPSLWKTIHAHFKLTGNIDKGKALRAVELSMDKYCSVAATLRAAGATITYEVSLTNL